MITRKMEMEMKMTVCSAKIFLFLLMIAASTRGGSGWSKEGHLLTCRIAQGLLEPGAADAVKNLLPEYAGGDLSALCVWPDQARHWYKYRWTSALHFIDTHDDVCDFDYSRDCLDEKGEPERCVAGAIYNFTSQLLHYNHGTADRRYNFTEALLFLSHFLGDIHQPMHVGFRGDEGGNGVKVNWFGRKTNLHHVWDRDIILAALEKLYGNDMEAFQAHISSKFISDIWSEELSSWGDCDDLFSCPKRYAEESARLACWGYRGINEGAELGEEYFEKGIEVVERRIAQGGARLAIILNRVFGDHNQDILPPV